MLSSHAPVGTITIRRLDSRVKEQLRMRAARSGRSMEAEARTILSEALVAGDGDGLDLVESIRRRVAPLGGIDLDEHPAVAIAPPLSYGPRGGSVRYRGAAGAMI